MSQRKWYGGTKNWLAFAFTYLYIHFCIYKHTHFILSRYIFVTFHGETFCLLFLSSNFEFFICFSFALRCRATVIVQMPVLSRHDGRARYVHSACLSTKVWMRSMASRRAVRTHRARSANYLTTVVIQYQQYLLHCPHVYPLSLDSIQNGCFSR